MFQAQLAQRVVMQAVYWHGLCVRYRSTHNPNAVAMTATHLSTSTLFAELGPPQGGPALI